MDMMTYAMAKAYTDTLKKNGGVGYTEETVIFPSTELELSDEGEFYFWFEDPSPFTLNKGQMYTVVWNGVEYSRVANTFIDSESNSLAAYIGNCGILGFTENTGEPFLILHITQLDDGFQGAQVCTTEPTATMSISTEIVHPIEPKYLVKTIDLDKYGIGDVVMRLFASGGGNEQMTDMGRFFEDVSTQKELRLVMAGMGFNFVIDQCARACDDDRVVQIAFAVMLAYHGAVYNINAAVQGSGGTATVYVTVT